MRVLVGCPSYDGKIMPELLMSLEGADRDGMVAFKHYASSVLPHTFNVLYCEALNLRPQVTHFLMIHADILPEKGFMKIMLDEMESTGADILSAVVPKKDNTGDTSTVIDDLSLNPKALKLEEALALGDTFTDPNLLLNSGLMLVDLRKDWVTKVCFRFNNSIVLIDGQYKSVCETEDYLFSKDARKLGAKLYATNKVALSHIGPYHYLNRIPNVAYAQL